MKKRGRGAGGKRFSRLGSKIVLRDKKDLGGGRGQ